MAAAGSARFRALRETGAAPAGGRDDPLVAASSPSPHSGPANKPGEKPSRKVTQAVPRRSWFIRHAVSEVTCCQTAGVRAQLKSVDVK
jgi:hypothetical protein